jgi:hypothetical protein
VATGTIYKSSRLFYSSGINTVGLTNGSYYFFKQNTGALGTAITGLPSNQSWNLLASAGYLLGQGIFVIPDNATTLTLMATAPALTGASAVNWWLQPLFDPPSYTVPTIQTGVNQPQPTDNAGSIWQTAAVAVSTPQMIAIQLRASGSIFQNSAGNFSVNLPPPRYFMFGLTATTWPASAGTIAPVQLSYT